MIEFEKGTEEEHMRNFNKISRDLKNFEDEYKECITNIHDQVFTEEEIEECVGTDFNKVILDIKYETLKIVSRGDARVKEFFLEHCYKPAGTNEQFATACDIMERDMQDMLWNCMDFIQICRLNEDKYLSVVSAMPRHNFEQLMGELGEFSTEFFELLDEVDSHKEVTVLRLKQLVDDRTKLIIEEAQANSENPLPKIIKHDIQITTEVNDPNIKTDHLPGDQFAIELPEQAETMAELDAENHSSELKTRKLHMLQKKTKALQSIRQRNQKMEALRKRNGGKYTRLFRGINKKYDGLNRENVYQNKFGHHMIGKYSK